MSYDDHDAAFNTVAWGFGDASPAPGGKWGGLEPLPFAIQGCASCFARCGLKAEGTNRSSWRPGRVFSRIGSVLADMRDGQERLKHSRRWK